jgi:hypothetical protein
MPTVVQRAAPQAEMWSQSGSRVRMGSMENLCRFYLRKAGVSGGP